MLNTKQFSVFALVLSCVCFGDPVVSVRFVSFRFVLRFVSRFVSRSRDEDVSPPCPSHAQAMGTEETWALISHLTTTLVRELEPERLSEVQRGLAHVASRVTATTDLEMVIPELIHLLGGDGKALRALKMVSDE